MSYQVRHQVSYPSPAPHVPLMYRSCAPIPHTQIRISDPTFRKSSWCGIFPLDAEGYGAVGCAHHRMERWEQRKESSESD